MADRGNQKALAIGLDLQFSCINHPRSGLDFFCTWGANDFSTYLAAPARCFLVVFMSPKNTYYWRVIRLFLFEIYCSSCRPRLSETENARSRPCRTRSLVRCSQSWRRDLPKRETGNDAGVKKATLFFFFWGGGEVFGVFFLFRRIFLTPKSRKTRFFFLVGLSKWIFWRILKVSSYRWRVNSLAKAWRWQIW